jgi:hypothetical protein
MESAPIAGLSLDVSSCIADDDANTGGGYTTVVDSVSGSLAFYNGDLSGVTMTAHIRFDYDFSDWGLGTLGFPGTLVINDSVFSLHADSSHPSFDGMEPIRFRWDVNGTVKNLVAPPATAVAASTNPAALHGSKSLVYRNGAVSWHGPNARLRLYDATGRTCLTRDMARGEQLPAGALPAGAYIARIAESEFRFVVSGKGIVGGAR